MHWTELHRPHRVGLLFLALSLGCASPARAAAWAPGNPNIPGTYAASVTFDLNEDGIPDFQFDPEAGAMGVTWVVTPLTDGQQMVTTVFGAAGDVLRFETADAILSAPVDPAHLTANPAVIPTTFLDSSGYLGVIVTFRSWLPEPDRDYYGYFHLETTNGTLHIFDSGFQAGPQGAVGDEATTPSLWLGPPTPNPMSSSSRLTFSLAHAGAMKLVVYDVSGRRVRVLASGVMPAGPGEVRWDGRDDRGRRVADGTYFYRLHAAGETRSGRLVVAG